MSVELLDRTRKIGRLLNDRQSSKVAFSDICSVLGQMMLSTAVVISNKGKILGAYQRPEQKTIKKNQTARGDFVDKKLNERLLSVLSTKENANLEMLGFTKDEVEGYSALITPINMRGERLGTLFLYRDHVLYGIEDIILSEYSTTVIGLEIVRSDQGSVGSGSQQKEKPDPCNDDTDTFGVQGGRLCDPRDEWTQRSCRYKSVSEKVWHHKDRDRQCIKKVSQCRADPDKICRRKGNAD